MQESESGNRGYRNTTLSPLPLGPVSTQVLALPPKQKVFFQQKNLLFRQESFFFLPIICLSPAVQKRRYHPQNSDSNPPKSSPLNSVPPVSAKSSTVTVLSCSPRRASCRCCPCRRLPRNVRLCSVVVVVHVVGQRGGRRGAR